MQSWRPTSWTSRQCEERRLAAARLFRRRTFSDAEIARQLGVGRSAVCAWHRAYRRGGLRALLSRPRTGRPSRLTTRQWVRLTRLLERGALRCGFDTERWTLRRIAELVWRVFHVRYHPGSLERPLKARGFSVQRPATRARERDEYVIARWPTREWIALKKRPAASAGAWSWSMRPAIASVPARAAPGRAAAAPRCFAA